MMQPPSSSRKLFFSLSLGNAPGLELPGRDIDVLAVRMSPLPGGEDRNHQPACWGRFFFSPVGCIAIGRFVSIFLEDLVGFYGGTKVRPPFVCLASFAASGDDAV
jgi:hypothetical protein